jgi:secreted effector protein SseC
MVLGQAGICRFETRSRKQHKQEHPVNTTINTNTPNISGAGFQNIDDTTDISLDKGRRVKATQHTQVEARSQKEHGNSAKAHSYRTPAKPREPVSLREAQAAFSHVLGTLLNTDDTKAANDATSGAGTAGGGSFTLARFEALTPEDMNLMLTQLTVGSLADTARVKAEGLKIREEGAERLRLRQNDDLRKQIDDSIKQQQQTQKSGKAAEIIDWIVGAAEVISGAIKMALGDELGGAADLAAGCAGLVKAYAEHMEQEDPANADHWKQMASDAGKVQLAFEIIGAAVDIMSVGKGIMAAKSVAQGASKALAEASGEAISAGMEIGGEIGAQATKNVIKAFAMEVADNVAETVARQVSGPLAKAFSKEAIEKLVAKAAETAVKDAMESGAKVTAKSISKEIVKQIAKDTAKVVAKTVLGSVGNRVKSAGDLGGKLVDTIVTYDINKQNLELKALIKKLQAEGEFMQFLLDDFEQVKKHAQQDMKDLLDDAGKALNNCQDQSQKMAAALTSVVTRIA